MYNEVGESSTPRKTGSGVYAYKVAENHWEKVPKEISVGKLYYISEKVLKSDRELLDKASNKYDKQEVFDQDPKRVHYNEYDDRDAEWTPYKLGRLWLMEKSTQKYDPLTYVSALNRLWGIKFKYNNSTKNKPQLYMLDSDEKSIFPKNSPYYTPKKLKAWSINYPVNYVRLLEYTPPKKSCEIM